MRSAGRRAGVPKPLAGMAAREAGLAIELLPNLLVFGVVLAIGLSGAGRAATLGSQSRAGWQPAPPSAPKPIMSNDGLLGLREVSVQTHVAGDDQWRKVVGLTQDSLKADVESRLRKVTGLVCRAGAPAPAMPRFLVQVIGHVIAGFPGGDPPSATYITVGVLQPVSLLRTGPRGEQIIANGLTANTTLLLTGRASTMRSRVSEKLASLLNEFEKDYHKANSGPAM